jgi:hypothetical protein
MLQCTILGISIPLPCRAAIEKEGEKSRPGTDSIGDAPKISAGTAENALNIC